MGEESWRRQKHLIALMIKSNLFQINTSKLRVVENGKRLLRVPSAYPSTLLTTMPLKHTDFPP